MLTSHHKLSILIATQGRREMKFRTLLESLMRQVRACNGDVEVVAYWNNGELPIGAIRQALVMEARGEYVCFVDDDDELPDYYCQQILWALGKDYVGFEVKLLNDGKVMPPVFHSLKYPNWHQDNTGYYRDITHLNPIRRALALEVSFGLEDGGEDEAWANRLRPLVKDENYIDKIMYIYHHDKEDSSFGGATPPKMGYDRVKIDYKYFRYHPASKLISEEVCKL